MQKKFELVHLTEHTHPDYATPVYLVQFAIDGQVSPPFWSTKKDRVDMGEDLWFESLKENAAGALAECGPGKALTN